MIRIRGGRSQAGPNRNMFAERENVVFFKHFEKANGQMYANALLKLGPN